MVPMHQSRCLESRFDIGRPFGPVTFIQCIIRCEEHRFQRQHAFDFPYSAASRGCGAVAYRSAGDESQPSSTIWRMPPEGMCQLKATKCTLKAGVPGRCGKPDARRDRRKRGWCIFQLRQLARGRYMHPPADATCEERECATVQASTISPAHVVAQEWASEARWPKRWIDPMRPRPAPSAAHAGGSAAAAPTLTAATTSAELVYYEAVDGGQLAVLGGGLNNMLMNLAQLLTDSCEAGGVLLLPPLDADPLRDTRAEAIMRSCKRITYYSDSRRPPVCEWQNRARPALVNFGEVFDLQHFASRLRPSCVRLGGPRTADIMAVAPPPGASIVTHNIHPLHATWWDMRKYVAPRSRHQLLAATHCMQPPAHCMQPSPTAYNHHPLLCHLLRYGPMLREVYAATQLGAAVRRLLCALLASSCAHCIHRLHAPTACTDCMR